MIKEILEGKEVLNEGAMKGKWTSRKGYGDPAGFAYKDGKLSGTISWRWGEFEGHLWDISDGKNNNNITLVDELDRQTYTEIKDAFKEAGYTLPKEIKDKLGKAILKELGL